MDAIASPCVDNCCLNEEDICLGCFRSLDEILGWRAASNKQRQTFVEQAVCRRESHRRKYSLAGDSEPPTTDDQ
ncbi:MAG: DUF1289 domain-containing protein [Gammaproteobacteria bacterium]|nr:DUF1289 domain-containing protein [Gammaproteobacteria bacterium]MBQ0840649.1 DUF1289 domain-containing protein [Gammaproteobacteria bacterium]